MTWFQRQHSVNAKDKRFAILALGTLIFALSAYQSVQGQTTSSNFNFRSGQKMYIVAYRRTVPYVTVENNSEPVTQPASRNEYSDLDLDAERKIRKRIEDWTTFKVAEKPSEADFIFLVNLDMGSIEGLAIPFDAYREHFKERYDLDALREAAYGRYSIGPLKLATISRLTDRLVKQFNEKVKGSAPR